ncbi:hypothetical protein ACH35V_03260 [Actinomadura sp. 1N219]|uniref:hypothetical protein n=1 Tax=Actinomadura sp. 1N219 TaxID=3375152 RepID=UPI003790BED9
MVPGGERDVDDRALPVGPEREEIAVGPPARAVRVSPVAASAVVTVTPAASWSSPVTSTP